MLPSKEYQILRQHITEIPPQNWDWIALKNHLEVLSRIERGHLLVLLWQNNFAQCFSTNEYDRRTMAAALSAEPFGKYQDRPIFDTQAADIALHTIAANIVSPPPEDLLPQFWDRELSTEETWKIILGRCSGIVCSNLAEEPGKKGRDALKIILQNAEFPSPIAKLVAAHLTEELEQKNGIIQRLKISSASDLVTSEIDALLTAPAIFWPTLFGNHFAEDLPENVRDETCYTLGSLKAYRDFARNAITFALERVRDVQTGKVPYEADKLVTRSEASAIARSFRLVFAEELDWGLEALGEIWRGCAFAPNEKAKTLPSQNLTYEIGRAVIAEPHPQAVILMNEIASKVRHASVKKRLSRFATEAISALKARPDRVFNLTSNTSLPSGFSKILKPALEGLLTRDWAMDGNNWSGQMTEKSLWPLTSRLIWQVDDFSGVPKKIRNELVWRLADGSTKAFSQKQSIRLWHPIEANENERQSWRSYLVKNSMTQPFAQAFREIYFLHLEELQTAKSDLFSGYTVAQIPLIGLSRRSGFKPGYHDELELTLCGQKFRFQSGVRNFPGAGGEGTTGSIELIGPAQTLGAVHPRILNEVLRRVDLITAVGTAGIEDEFEQVHNAPHRNREIPGNQSIEMRRCFLQLFRPETVFAGRWLKLQNDLRIHLGTGRLDKNGTPVDLPSAKPQKAPKRSDDPIMNRIWCAIEAYGIEKKG